ncbi:hypothetical protein G1H11_06480 [Phytoactinopolyspora alkaliphila]|uniref:Zf-HC2 domain-containing protein n=1 Tax=Phytoactinopolyspora alkaliphila TaxID=1783498 RepID=A0A6N9YIW5_9ACTN|nr:hypothetical protein [Phytoactinopolyspora alkaliphila]NED94956.1 hypothetical protein [Phytoactinopolyspora alkaliphila]
MSERHPTEDALLDLALGDVPEPGNQLLTQHLSTCPACRKRYDAINDSIELTLPAAPRVQPAPGFDQAVLEAMGMSGPTARRRVAPQAAGGGTVAEPGRAPRRRSALVALAAGVAGVVIGVGGSMVAGSLDDGPPAATVDVGTPLVTDEGEAVGTATLSYLGDQRVVVVAAANGDGRTYECRLRLPDGQTSVLGEWTVPDTGSTWVMPAPYADSMTVELVDDSGAVWSTARL